MIKGKTVTVKIYYMVQLLINKYEDRKKCFVKRIYKL